MDRESDILHFRSLCIDDRDSVQALTLRSGLRNCNYSFTNLFGWQPLFLTELCLVDGAVVFRYRFEDRHAYMVNANQPPSQPLLEALHSDARALGEDLMLFGFEDSYAESVCRLFPHAEVAPVRNSYDYIYLREELESLYGKDLKAKRNHVNKFVSEHPYFSYRELDESLFGQCLELERHWRFDSNHDNPVYGDTIATEQQVMERIFNHWNRLDAIGGAIFVGDRMVAFSYGAPVTNDTFDVCVEKADRSVDGAFNIINQQLVHHLPTQYRYINREEDMGLPGLRKAKLSYHPHQLLSFNIITIK